MLSDIFRFKKSKQTLLEEKTRSVLGTRKSENWNSLSADEEKVLRGISKILGVDSRFLRSDDLMSDYFYGFESGDLEKKYCGFYDDIEWWMIKNIDSERCVFLRTKMSDFERLQIVEKMTLGELLKILSRGIVS